MLRMLFAIAFILYGARQALRSPFHALLFYLALAYFRPETWVWYGNLQALNLSFIVGVYTLTATAISPHERFARNAPVFLILLLCAHGLASTVLSDHFAWSYLWWKGFAKVTLITILIISLVNTEERFRLTLLVIAFCLGFEGIKQGWVYVLLRQDDVNLNSVEILGDNNGVAVGMLMLSAVLLALLQTSTRLSYKAGFAFMTVGTMARALATYSRGGLLSLGAMSVVYWSRSKHRLAIGLLMIVVGGGLLRMMPNSFWDRMDTITTDEGQMDVSSASRLHFWRTAIRMANDHPFFGVGHTGFQASYNDYDDPDVPYGRNRAVHSSWFGMLAEQGYVGLIIFVTIIALAFGAAGKARRLTREIPERFQTFTFAGAMQTALVTVIVGGTFLSYHYVEIWWHFLGLCFAIRRAAEHAVAQQPAAVTLQRPAAPAAFAPAFGYRVQGR